MSESSSPANTSHSSTGGKGSGYQWVQTGDVNAFFGLMLDNLAGLLLMVGLLNVGFGFPVDFAVSKMVPGTALGVLIGDLAFFWLAFRLAKRTGNAHVTAMPLGLDTPSTFGMILFILGPSFLDGQKLFNLSVEEAALRTWHIGIWCIVVSGVLKTILAPTGEWVRRVVPRAGLLGSLAAIALAIISFLPLTEILGHPLPGMVALVIVLMTLIGRLPLPGRVPGTLGALIVAGVIYYLMCAMGISGYEFPVTQSVTWLPTAWLDSWSFGWLGSFPDALPYFPIALPFALATVVGGIDCTESAAAAGDQYDTRSVLGIEAVATLLAGLSGGVIQTTPYIGHPAYKAMGGRAAYSLATALVIGSAGMIGYFAVLNAWIPKPAVYPILVFIGLEITAQSFMATPRRHYPAVALACVPALAFLAMNLPGRMFGDGALLDAGINPTTLADGALAHNIATVSMLSSGFILTSLIWAWMLVAGIDGKLKVAATVLSIAGVLTLFGLIHSPLPGNQLFLPFGPSSWQSIVLPSEYRGAVYEFAAGYGVAAALLFLWSKVLDPTDAAKSSDETTHGGLLENGDE